MEPRKKTRKQEKSKEDVHGEAPPKELGRADAAHDADVKALVDGEAKAEDEIEDREDGGDAPFATSAIIDVFVVGHRRIEFAASGATDGGGGVVDGVFFPVFVGCAGGEGIGAGDLPEGDAKADATAQKETDMAMKRKVLDKAHVKGDVRQAVVYDLSFAGAVAFVEKDVRNGTSFAVGSVGEGEVVPTRPKSVLKITRRT